MFSLYIWHLHFLYASARLNCTGLWYNSAYGESGELWSTQLNLSRNVDCSLESTQGAPHFIKNIKSHFHIRILLEALFTKFLCLFYQIEFELLLKLRHNQLNTQIKFPEWLAFWYPNWWSNTFLVLYLTLEANRIPLGLAFFMLFLCWSNFVILFYFRLLLSYQLSTTQYYFWWNKFDLILVLFID